MKLKTLKDLVKEKEVCKGCAYVEKQKAIEHIKSDEYFPSANFWIKHFFNITEEDLK